MDLVELLLGTVTGLLVGMQGHGSSGSDVGFGEGLSLLVAVLLSSGSVAEKFVAF